MQLEPLEYVETILITAAPEDVFAALVDPERVNQYHMAPLFKIGTVPGEEILYGSADDIMISGRITRLLPGEVLEHTFRFGPESHAGTEVDADTLVNYTLEPVGGETRLTLRHSGFAEENQTFANISGGWPYILEGLKGYLEGTTAD